MAKKKKVAKRNVQSLAVSNHVQDLTMFYFRLRKWVDTIPYIFFNHSNLVEYVTYLISYVRMTLYYRKMETDRSQIIIIHGEVHSPNNTSIFSVLK